MNHGLRVDPRDAVPIWRQIEDGVRRLVAAGSLVPGAGVPSVRELAQDLGVNPATVSKAYQRLTDAGLLEVRRGEGTFVSQSPRAVPRAERSRRLRDSALRYAGTALAMGATPAEALDELREALARMGQGSGGSDER
jgi:GntR family transcriptional regulator